MLTYYKFQVIMQIALGMVVSLMCFEVHFSFTDIRIVFFFFFFFIAYQSAELERYGYHFANLVVHLLRYYKVTNHPRLINIFIILHFPNLLTLACYMSGKIGFVCYSNKNTCG